MHRPMSLPVSVEHIVTRYDDLSEWVGGCDTLVQRFKGYQLSNLFGGLNSVC